MMLWVCYLCGKEAPCTGEPPVCEGCRRAHFPEPEGGYTIGTVRVTQPQDTPWHWPRYRLRYDV